MISDNALLCTILLVLGIYMYSPKDNKATVTVDENGVTIKVPNLGKLRGANDFTSWTNQEFYKFLGIPFAEPPLNHLRFKAPVPISEWEDTKDATKFGKRCPAPIDYIPIEDQKFDSSSEDCLNLCVYTKNFTDMRPVMVYIHGGALWNGTASEHPANFLLEKDIVYVAIQYRLGALGFISTESEDIPGNMGILDVKLALEWVQKNIKHFGGNSDDVTVFGESAGGAITSLLMISPHIPQNLFQKAIIQSGSVLMPGIYDYNPLENAEDTCKNLGCKYCEKIVDINKCLNGASVTDLIRIAHNSPSAIPYGLTINDFHNVLPKKPKQLLYENSKKYQLMGGFMKNDGGFLISLFLELEDNPQLLVSTLIQLFGGFDAAGIIENLITKLYFVPGELENSTLKELMPKIVDISSMLMFKSPVHKFVEFCSKKNSDLDNYLYSIDYVGEHVYIPIVLYLQKKFPYYPFVGGVHHADDLLYLFPTKQLNENDTEMAKIIVDIWTSFAINGKPEYENGQELLPVKNAAGPYFHIDKKITIGRNFLDEL